MHTWHFIVCMWTMHMWGVYVYIYFTCVYGHCWEQESNYVNECIWGVRGMSRLPASVTVCLLVTAQTHSAQTWINKGRERERGGEREKQRRGRKERKWLTCKFNLLRTHSEAYFTACEACQALLIKQKQHNRLPYIYCGNLFCKSYPSMQISE